jgi:hypothetical protein
VTRFAAISLLLVAGFGGCDGHSGSQIPSALGRSLTAAPGSVTPAPASIGDPPEERNGTVSNPQTNEENSSRSDSVATSPQAALMRYALVYTNWQASSLDANERDLASMAIGDARLAAEQTAASDSGTAALAADHVRNTGAVLAITPGQGPALGRWVIVTLERTTGTGSYAGLPPSIQVALARIAFLHSGWVVSEWMPQS